MKLTLALAFLLSNEPIAAFVAPGRIAGRTAFVTEQRKSLNILHGILDEIQSDSYDLMSSTNEAELPMNDNYEIFLGELVFSANDPRVDIVNKIELAGDPEFLEWLENKIQNSGDPDERIALRDLLDMIEDVKTKLEVNRAKEEREAEEAAQAEAKRIAAAEEAAAAGREMSDTDVLRKATAIDNAAVTDGTDQKEKKTFYEQDLTQDIRLSYEKLLKKVMPPYKAGESPASVVANEYTQFDAQFVKVLNERAANGDSDAAALLQALAVEQQRRVSAAAEVLKEVLSLGEPMRMEGAIVKFVREGRIDEAFLLLLEANADQARAAGASGPAELMDKLRRRAMDEKDKQASSKEIRLIRQLLRTDDAKEREKLFEDAFTPKDELLVPGTAANAQKAVDGELPEAKTPMPEIPPPDFINACKAVLLNFGNLGTNEGENADLASKIKQLAAEAEVVTTRIYGQGMTLRDQQDRMWKEQTTSIFDLENMEIEAERMGGRAPWTNPEMDDILPGFDAEGKMKIGGN